MRARGGHVGPCHSGEPAEVFTRSRLDREVELTADCTGDLPERDGLVCDRVVDRLRHALLQGKPVNARCIQPMNTRPAVLPLVDIGRNASLARQLDQHRNKAVFADPVN